LLFFAEASRSCGGSDIVISPYCCTNDRLVVYKAVRQRLLALKICCFAAPNKRRWNLPRHFRYGKFIYNSNTVN